ncbi:hypothetical protein [Mucilaginibacter aquaedulcis]|jgi:hypothetical protein|uniref:hypothetical protein n=1 Tax=Mucilaginibacter aquaedulcis TaxID=1187081 RepID=UPI0025B36D6E|nr:hypothetical protein [Mucilaginibacter aquaedulcis]MDN3547194.1 hypothetical protein [Mucilaginibacter aquaedulcis]
MKLRITPLNFATTFFILVAAYIWIYGAHTIGRPLENWSGTIGWIFLLFAFVVFFLDLIFRNFFAELKKLWLVELCFIALVVIIFLIVK